MTYSRYKRQRILYFHLVLHLRYPTIAKVLDKEGMIVSRRGVYKFLKRYYLNHTIARQPGSGRPSLVTAAVKQIVDEQMRKNDETTAYQLHALLVTVYLYAPF